MQLKKMSCPLKKFESYKIVGLSLNIVFAPHRCYVLLSGFVKMVALGGGG